MNDGNKNPLDDMRALLASLQAGDGDAANRMRTVFAMADRRRLSLGRLEELAVWLATWSGKAPPAVTRPLVALFAGTHGYAGDSAGTTAGAIERIAAGGAAVNQICAANDLGLKVFDLALDLPTGDIRSGEALDARACAATFAFGMEAVAGGTDLLCLGDLGTGDAVAVPAALCVLFGGAAGDWAAAQDVPAVEQALACHAGHLADPLEVLRRLCGREAAAIAGAIAAARAERIPVLIDGGAALVAAAVLSAVDRQAISHCLLAHPPALPGAAQAAERLGLKPLVDLDISQGEGVGAALAAGIVKAAARTASGLAETLR